MTSLLKRKKSRTGFLDIEDIRNGMIHLRGRRYRSVVTADPINFSLLSEEEQEAVEAAFGSMMMSLSFPVQLVIITRPVDMRDSILELRKNLGVLPRTMAEYEMELERFLAYFAGQTMITETFMVVPYDDEAGDYDRARGELMRRTRAVMEGLSKCGINPRMLDTGGLIQFLFAFFDRDSSLRTGDLLEVGALELYKGGRNIGAGDQGQG